MSALPTVLLLATPHLSDIAVPAAEAMELVERLARSEPDVVAVEARPKDEAQVQQRYERFLAGAEPLGRSEIDQIAFRLAQACGISAIRGFDADWQLEWSGLRQLHPSDEQIEALMSQVAGSVPGLSDLREASLSEVSLRDRLALVNSAEYQELDHRFYVRTAEVGDSANTGGAEYTASWYLRNLRMYANLVRLARPDHRVFALVGSGHAKILNDLLRQGGSVQVADPMEFLR